MKHFTMGAATGCILTLAFWQGTHLVEIQRKQTNAKTDQVFDKIQQDFNQSRESPADNSCMLFLSDDIKDPRPEREAIIKNILADDKFTRGECDNLMAVDSQITFKERQATQAAKLKKLKEQFNAAH